MFQKAIDEKVFEQQTTDKRFSLKWIESLFPKEEVVIFCGGHFVWYIDTKTFGPHVLRTNSLKIVT